MKSPLYCHSNPSQWQEFKSMACCCHGFGEVATLTHYYYAEQCASLIRPLLKTNISQEAEIFKHHNSLIVNLIWFRGHHVSIIWMCLWGCFCIRITEVRRPTLNVDGTPSMCCNSRLNKKEKRSSAQALWPWAQGATSFPCHDRLCCSLYTVAVTLWPKVTWEGQHLLDLLTPGHSLLLREGK